MLSIRSSHVAVLLQRSARVVALALGGLSFMGGLARAADAPPLTLAVDATEAPRGIFHAHLTVPATPGAFTLVYPKWIPGEHGPTGPIMNLLGLKLTAAGKPVEWKRDEVDMYAFHCNVPAGVTTLDATYDYMSSGDRGTLTGSPSTTSQLAIVVWNRMVLYPQGKASDDVNFAASLQLPAGWKFGTALPVTAQAGDKISFKTVSLTTLVDSPVIAGAHFKEIPLNPGQTPSHFIDLVADTDAAIDMKPELVAKYQNLVNEAGALFGARHYTTYHWLVTLNDHVAGGGLEHHESSDDRTRENALSSESNQRDLAGLLAHEYVHSWNGKYRRPAGLATPNYQEPMKGELLWVYEGLTEYYGTMLPPRAGLTTPEALRDKLAATAANMDFVAGRSWRPLEDTTVAAQLLYESPAQWRAYRRATDFYAEGILIWLDADTTIRQLTQGKKSLDDFCKKFHGGQDSAPSVKPYTEDEIIATLNDVAPYDWKGFFDKRINGTDPHAPLAGIEASGWKLVYTDTPSDDQKHREDVGKSLNLTFSIGLQTADDGTVRDLVPGLAADKAGLSPGMKIIAVNGRKWSSELLRTAVKASKTAAGPIELIVENNDFYKTILVDYHDGARYPKLERDAAKPDVLAEIIKATAVPAK